MNSPDWRSFASQEMVGLASDFDLAIQPSQNRESPNLLGNNSGDDISDYNLSLASLSQPSENYSLHDSGDTNVPSLRSYTSPNDHPRQKQTGTTLSPLKAQTLINWNGNSTYPLTWEVLGILVSLCFLVLGGFVAQLRGKDESAWSLRLLQATRIAPSLWPVLFSGILGNAVRALADWRLERGVDLLTAEQLMASLTLFNAITTVFKWSILRFSSVALIVLWAFNPLGSQSSFRGIYLEDQSESRTGSISSYNYNLSTQLGITYFQGGSNRAQPKMRALYSAALYDVMATTQYVDKTNAIYGKNIMTFGGENPAGIEAATDVWGNIRIPNLQTLPEYDDSNPHQWLHVPWQESVQNYSGLVGERIEGIQRSVVGDTRFNVTSSYQTFQCSQWIGLKNRTDRDQWMLETFDGRNYTQLTRTWVGNEFGERSFFVAKPGTEDVIPYISQSEDPADLIFGTTSDEPVLYTTRCSTRMIYVDMQVDCKPGSTLGKIDCGASWIRETLSPTDPANTTLLQSRWLQWPHLTGDGGYHNPRIHLFMEESFMDLLDHNVQGGTGASSFVEWYLLDPLTALNNPAKNGYTDLGQLDIKLFEKRFSLLWNTLWKISTQYESIMSGNMTQTAAYDSLVNTTSIMTIPLPAVYAIDLPWMTVYFVSVAVMFSAAVFSLVMRYRCHAPPLLGYVSSLIRDSKYFDDPEITGNSVESGTAMTNRLQNLRILLGDIKGGEEVGKLALVPVGDGRRLKRKRLYE